MPCYWSTRPGLKKILTEKSEISVWTHKFYRSVLSDFIYLNGFKKKHLRRSWYFIATWQNIVSWAMKEQPMNDSFPLGIISHCSLYVPLNSKLLTTLGVKKFILKIIQHFIAVSWGWWCNAPDNKSSQICVFFAWVISAKTLLYF